MSALSNRMAVLAQNMAQKYGATATLVRRTAGTFDPTTQTETGNSSSNTSIHAIIEEYRAHEVDGGAIRYGDKKITIPSLDIENLGEPQPDDIITIGGDSYRIVEVFGMSGGDSFVGYTVQARK